MVISVNSQLGLRFNRPEVLVEFVTLIRDYYSKELRMTQAEKVRVEDMINNIPGELTAEQAQDIEESLKNNSLGWSPESSDTRNKVAGFFGERQAASLLLTTEGSSYFYICDSVYKAAELIKVTEGFTGRTLKDIKFGKYTYLMGKHRMASFMCVQGAIRGIYFDDKNKVAFDWGIDMETGKYFFDKDYPREFTTLMQVLTFVELGDIEVVELLKGRNNGGKKNADKITNTSEYNVYVVDSSWNKLIIRTEGFAVRGHFRLQPCGDGMLDRRLIWISAFEKHGYVRKPKAQIIR